MYLRSSNDQFLGSESASHILECIKYVTSKVIDNVIAYLIIHMHVFREEISCI